MTFDLSIVSHCMIVDLLVAKIYCLFDALMSLISLEFGVPVQCLLQKH